jgi:hypothetical protein
VGHFEGELAQLGGELSHSEGKLSHFEGKLSQLEGELNAAAQAERRHVAEEFAALRRLMLAQQVRS